AWTWERGEAEAHARLAGALWRFWGGRGHLIDGRRWLERALTRRDDVPPIAPTEALIGAALLGRMQGDVEAASALADELLARSRGVGHAYGIFWGLFVLGWLAEYRGDDDRA